MTIAVTGDNSCPVMTTRWNLAVGAETVSPRAGAFLADLAATCEAQGLILVHENGPDATEARHSTRR